jgi:RecA/RadA recombinase
VLNSGFRRIVPLLSTSNTALVIVNQLRHVIQFGGYGPGKMIQVAEKPIKHGASVSIELENEKYIGPEGDPPTGIRVRAIVRENRIAPTQGWKETFDIDYMTGVVWMDSALDVLLHIGAVNFNQGWFTYKGKKFRRGEFKRLLKDKPELAQLVQDSPYIHKMKREEQR